GVLGYSTTRSFAVLFAAIVLLGIMIGSLMTAGTNTIVEVHAAHKGRYLNLSNIFHGVGSMLAPFYAGQMLAAGFSWRLVYQLCLVLAVLIAGLFLTIPASKAHPGHPPELRGHPSGSILDLYRGALNRRTAGYYLLSLLYVAAETGLIVWMVEFLQKGRGQPVLLSSTFLSLYFAGIITGRLAGSLLVDRLGYGIGALVCLALGIFGPPPLAFCLPLAGLFFATMAPTLAAAVTSANLGEPSRVNPHIQNAGTGTQKAGAGNTGSVLGLLLAAGGIGGMLGAWSAGFVSSFAGIQLGFGMQVVYIMLFVGVVLVLGRREEKAN
ncbi:MAG: MFS transporter, partial [Chloroflexi bacterium]|nr:MFS transporter [Chloroflexota bacterium]